MQFEVIVNADKQVIDLTYMVIQHVYTITKVKTLPCFTSQLSFAIAHNLSRGKENPSGPSDNKIMESKLS